MSNENETEMEGVTFTDPEGRVEVMPLNDKIAGFSGFVDDDVVNRIIDAFGSVNEYTCAVYHKKTGIGQKMLVGNYRNEIPLPDEIGAIVGSGRLQYMITAKGKSKKREMRDFWIDLADNFDTKAENNRIEERQKMLVRAGGREVGGSRSEGVALEILAKLAIREPPPNNNMEFFRLMIEMQSKSEERTAQVLEKMGANFEKMIDKMSSKGNDLQGLATSIALIKEISGNLGGESQKGLVAEIMEAASPMICSAIEAFGGRGRPAGIEREEVDTTEEEAPKVALKDIPVSPETMKNMEAQLVADFPALAKAVKNPIKRKLVKNQILTVPIFKAIFSNEIALARIKAQVGAEIFDGVMEAIK
jgi:hypothetical protein